jgi:hypothetical protein
MHPVSQQRGIPEEDRAAAIMSLYARLFTEMGSYDIDFGLFTDQAHSSGLIAVDAAEPRTKVTVGQVGVRS